MSISREDVLHVAMLARFELNEEEIAMFTKQLSQVIEHASMINIANTEGVEPTSHPLSFSNVMREDMPEEPLSQGDALKNAPAPEGGAFLVPKIIS